MRALPARIPAVCAVLLAVALAVPADGPHPPGGAGGQTPAREAPAAGAASAPGDPAARRAPRYVVEVPDDAGAARPGLAPLVSSVRGLWAAGGAMAGALEDERLVYAAALHAQGAGRHDAAEAGFRAVRDAGGLLAPMAQLRLAQALSAQSKHSEAAAAFERTFGDEGLPEHLRVPAMLEAAQAYLRAGWTAPALERLARIDGERLATAAERGEAHWRAAHIRRALHDDGWTEDAVAALTLAPWTAAARHALDALEDAGAPFPLLDAAQARYRGRQDGQARDLYERAIEDGLPDDEAAVAWFYLGALAERSDDLEGAADAYARSLEHAPDGPLADDARYWRARVLDEDGQDTAAVEEYDRLVADFPDSPFTADAEVRAAVTLSLAGKPGPGLERLERIAGKRTGRTAAKAARWHRMIARSAGRPGPPLDPAAYAPTALATVMHDDSMGPLPEEAFDEWPAVRPDPEVVDAWMAETFGERPASTVDGVALKHPLSVLGRELVAAGEHGVGRSLLRRAVALYDEEPYALLDLARAAEADGVYDIAMLAGLGILSPLSPEERLDVPKDVLRMAYPVAYMSELSNAVAEYRVPPLLMLALIRQESAFNPRAGSHAGALGLMQVIEPTGKRIARAIGVPWDRDDLYDPAVSLRFGAFYLSAQLEEFDGNAFAALAAYNAGPPAVTRWLDAQDVPGPDGFLLAVEFAETSLYLEKVLENYAWYRYVYAGAPMPSLP